MSPEATPVLAEAELKLPQNPTVLLTMSEAQEYTDLLLAAGVDESNIHQSLDYFDDTEGTITLSCTMDRKQYGAARELIEANKSLLPEDDINGHEEYEHAFDVIDHLAGDTAIDPTYDDLVKHVFTLMVGRPPTDSQEDILSLKEITPDGFPEVFDSALMDLFPLGTRVPEWVQNELWQEVSDGLSAGAEKQLAWEEKMMGLGDEIVKDIKPIKEKKPQQRKTKKKASS